MQDLKGKVTVITGGGTGIGLATGIELAAQGDAKIVIASTNEQRLNEGADKIRAAGNGVEVLPVICDQSSRESIQNLYDQTIKRFGRVDVVIANAGVTTSGPYLNHRPEDWEWVWGVCLLGVGYIVQIFYPTLCKQKAGHIVITGSQAGMNPTWFTEHGPYTAAKSGAMALGASLRPEAAEHNVGVTSVIVAGTETDIMQCERSRPAAYGETQGLKRERRAAERLPASAVGKMIVEGIQKNKEFVATHPGLKEMQKGYFDRILASYDH